MADLIKKMLTIANLKATEIGTREIKTSGDIEKIETLALRDIRINAKDSIRLHGCVKVLIVANLHYISPLQEQVESYRYGELEEQPEGDNVDASQLEGLEWVIDVGDTDGEGGCWCEVANKPPDKKINSIEINRSNGTATVYIDQNGDDYRFEKEFKISDSPVCFLKFVSKRGLPATALKFLVDELGGVEELRELDELFFPDDNQVLRELKKLVKDNLGSPDSLDQEARRKVKLLLSATNESFTIPPEFRDGSITAKQLREWAMKKYELDDKDDILLGLEALEGIKYLLDDQDDDDYAISDKSQTRAYQGAECASCAVTSDVIYTCCDYVYPLQKSWSTPSVVSARIVIYSCSSMSSYSPSCPRSWRKLSRNTCNPYTPWLV